MRFVFFGLTLSSSWGNGHATTYRSLVRALHALGHEVTFFEQDAPYYAAHRDLSRPKYCRLVLYRTFAEVAPSAARAVDEADVAVLGSYLPDGIRVADWLACRPRVLRVYYDIDTPVTVSALRAEGATSYLRADQLASFDLVLSFTGGPLLAELERTFRVRRARALYCSVDPEVHRPAAGEAGLACDLGYMGTYAASRQDKVRELLLEPARRLPALRFLGIGPLYPDVARWPENVAHREHLAPGRHAAFYASGRMTLNLTRREMVEIGHSPSVRLFEAGACAAPLLSDPWPGLEELFTPGEEVLVARSTDDVVTYLTQLTPGELSRLGARARERVLGAHTAAHRARELLAHVLE